MSAVTLPKRTILLRGLRGRGPACGVGRIFERAFESVERCGPCGFTFERGPGHWIGGNEINVIVTYPVSCLALVVPCFVYGASWISATIGGVLALAIGFAVHRPARGLFFAIDYLVEPEWTPGGADGADGRGDGPDGAPVRPDGPAPGFRREAAIELPVPVPAPRRDVEPSAVPAPPVVPARPQS